VIGMSFGVGAFSGPLITAAVLAATQDYRAVFLGVAVSLLVPLLIYAWLPLAGPPAGHETTDTPVPRAGLVALALLAAVSALYLGGEIGFGGWIFTYVRQTTTADLHQAAWVVAAYWLALSVGSLGAAVRPRRAQADGLVLVCAVGATLAALAVLGARGSPGLELVASCALGLFLGPIYPLTLANAAGLVPAAAGRVGAIVEAISAGGGGVLPWLQGVVFSSGPFWEMGMTVLVCLSMTVLHLGYMRVCRGHRRFPSPPTTGAG